MLTEPLTVNRINRITPVRPVAKSANAKNKAQQKSGQYKNDSVEISSHALYLSAHAKH